MAKTQEVLQRVYKFRSLANAFSFADTASLPMTVMMGDAPFFWVCTFADAEHLHKAGYEYAHRQGVN